jgi:hypothetical protein
LNVQVAAAPVVTDTATPSLVMLPIPALVALALQRRIA